MDAKANKLTKECGLSEHAPPPILKIKFRLNVGGKLQSLIMESDIGLIVSVYHHIEFVLAAVNQPVHQFHDVGD